MSARRGPNDRLPCGTDSARRHHLAHGQSCATCGTDRAIPDSPTSARRAA